MRRPSGPIERQGHQQGFWKELDKCIPPTLNRKVDHRFNPELDKRVWAWLYRYNHSTCRDGFKKGGELVNCK